MISACLWFIARDKKNHKFRDRSEQILFIDARNMGTMVDRRHRELTDDDIRKIADTYHAWRGETGKKYLDIPGLCKSATLDEVRKQQWILTPGRYVGAEEGEEEDDGSIRREDEALDGGFFRPDEARPGVGCRDKEQFGTDRIWCLSREL